MKKRNFFYKKRFFEKIAWQKKLLVCGIDEAGRGPLAGPVVVSAAIIPPNSTYTLLKDSKILSKKELVLAYEWISKNGMHASVIYSWKEIDKHNIYQATLKAMKRAYLLLLEKYKIRLEDIKYLLIDAMPLKVEPPYKHKNMDIEYFPHGEIISPSIAAASIVAKVTRDNLMQKMSKLFPAFKLDKHKGYATKEHWNLIGRHGESIIHRKTYVRNARHTLEKAGQMKLFE
ncbi:ribonuclease HII [Candidatus Babeliales bacterium]|nr:ribonuclease HII [Candidatus Babeliales bacterium]